MTNSRRVIRAEKPALVLLDLMLPGTDGVELMQTVPELADMPVIFISGYGRDETIARALEAGAEDYIVKPFSPTELTARVRAALRRRSYPAPFALGELTIDYDRRRVTVAGRPVALTATEYELLRVLSQGARPGPDPRNTAAPGLGRTRRRSQDRARLRQAAAQQARRRCGTTRPWIFNERGGRLPHGPPRRPVAPGSAARGRRTPTHVSCELAPGVLSGRRPTAFTRSKTVMNDGVVRVRVDHVRRSRTGLRVDFTRKK